MSQLDPAGKVRVQWSLYPDFNEPTPWRFQLHVNYDGDPENWEPVGNEVEDTFYVEQPLQLARFKNLLPQFKVVLIAAKTYDSLETTVLPKKLALIGQGIYRRLLLERSFMPRPKGILLRRKTSGQICTSCADKFGKQPLQSDCTTCYGTGIVGGYWKANTDNLGLLSEDVSAAAITQMGHIDPARRKAIIVGLPQPTPGDIWIDSQTGRRYRVRTVAVTSAIFDWPIVVQAELGLLAPKDVIYQFPL